MGPHPSQGKRYRSRQVIDRTSLKIRPSKGADFFVAKRKFSAQECGSFFFRPKGAVYFSPELPQATPGNPFSFLNPVGVASPFFCGLFPQIFFVVRYLIFLQQLLVLVLERKVLMVRLLAFNIGANLL